VTASQGLETKDENPVNLSVKTGVYVRIVRYSQRNGFRGVNEPDTPVLMCMYEHGWPETAHIRHGFTPSSHIKAGQAAVAPLSPWSLTASRNEGERVEAAQLVCL
jgi:hypothetical protein